MKKEDLINGGYYHYDFSTGVIFKYNRGASVIEIRNGTTLYRNQSWGFDCAVLRPATKDETTWLKACEKADKFVSKEEALKPQFEIGKWYKGLGFGEGYIAKFNYLTAKRFYFTECISPITGYSKTNAYLEIYDNVIECPLSEIQQYLPDGHPDKFVNKSETSPLPEKWYLEVTKDNLSYVSSKRAWSFDIIGYIHSSLSHNIHNYWFHNNEPLKGYTEITLEQFKEYVVKDVTSKKVEPEIPEYVECIQNGNNATMHQKYCGVNVVKGTIYKVTEKSMPNKGAQSEAYVLEGGGVGYCLGFKPSTKEAFDAQNKPKEQSIEEILEICKKKYPIDTEIKSVYGKRGVITGNYHIFDRNNIFATSDSKGDLILYRGSTKEYSEIISLPEPIKYPDLSFKDFGVHIHKGNYVGDVDPYQKELEDIIWSVKHTQLTPKECFKSNDLEFQYPVINVRNKKKSKLIIINQ